MQDVLVTKTSLNISERDFPGSLVAKTPHSQCRGPEFDP